jgi:hydrogenase maturation protease
MDGFPPSPEPGAPGRPRVLVAGFGNVLRGDDGFGVEIAQRLVRHADLPAAARVIEVGIGGMQLVHELQEGYGALLIVDAVDRGGAPGTIYLLAPDVPNVAALPYAERQDFLADMHLATPARAMILAKALGVLPAAVYILGCQPASCDDLTIGLTPPVAAALETSVSRLLREIGRLLAQGAAVPAKG